MCRAAECRAAPLWPGLASAGLGQKGAPRTGALPHALTLITGHILPSVLESPRDLQFSDIGETSAKVSWTPPLSRADSFKVSYQLVDGGDPLCQVRVGLVSPAPSTLPTLQPSWRPAAS